MLYGNSQSCIPSPLRYHTIVRFSPEPQKYPIYQEIEHSLNLRWTVKTFVSTDTREFSHQAKYEKGF